MADAPAFSSVGKESGRGGGGAISHVVMVHPLHSQSMTVSRGSATEAILARLKGAFVLCQNLGEKSNK